MRPSFGLMVERSNFRANASVTLPNEFMWIGRTAGQAMIRPSRSRNEVE